MMYKLLVNEKTYFVEDGRKPFDEITFPIEITKFRFWLWLFNPTVSVYMFFNNRWERVFNSKYIKLLK